MTRDTTSAKDYFGYCIAQDKTATPIFEQLLTGIYGYITKHVAPWDDGHLTPVKLSQFYRLVGGDFDRLFLDSPPASLSFVYSSLGCQHSLHQEQNLFEPPTIPALTAAGFVRWQVIQILLAPTEHVPYIQKAVSRFELLNSGPGGPFPKVFPAECLPTTPDIEIVEWHESVGRRLRKECRPRSRPTSVQADVPPVMSEHEFSPLNARRRPHLHDAQSPGSRRHSSSDAREEKRPSSPHPLRNSRRYQRATVESDSASSSSSESPAPARPMPKIKVPERSPRSYSAARVPYSPATSPYRNQMGRRHSSHGHDPKAGPNIKETLSPQFYGQNGVRPPSGNGPSPSSSAPPPLASGKSPMGPPPPQRRTHRHTVSHDRSKDASWKDKLKDYVGISSAPARRRNTSETRESDRDLDDSRRRPDNIRYVEGIGAIPLDRRRASPSRMESDTDGEAWRRSRRGRRSSGEDIGHDRTT